MYIQLLREGDLYTSQILSIKYFLNKIRIVALSQFESSIKDTSGLGENDLDIMDYLFFEN